MTVDPNSAAGPFTQPVQSTIPATAPQPQDHQSSTFTYTLPSGRQVTLPKLKKILTFGRMRRLRHLDEQDQTFTALEEALTEEQLAFLDELDSDETQAFFEAYQKDSGVNVGESTAS